MNRPGNRRFLVGFLLAALLVAGVASFYASGSPDGLSAVARDTGISQGEQSSPESDSPLAGYSTKGIDDARISKGVSGVAGSLFVLALAGGIFRVLRRREPTDDEED